MSYYQFFDKDGILEFEPPYEKLDVILAKLNYPSSKKQSDFTFEQRRIIFLVTFRLFINGDLYLEEFSEISNIVSMVFPPNGKTIETSDYELVIYEAADLSLYVRTYDKVEASRIAGILEHIWIYFNKYKHLLNELPEEFSTPSLLEK